MPTTDSCAGSANSERPDCAVNDARLAALDCTPLATSRLWMTSRSDVARAMATPGASLATPSITGPAAASPLGTGNCATGMNRSALMK